MLGTRHPCRLASAVVSPLCPANRTQPLFFDSGSLVFDSGSLVFLACNCVLLLLVTDDAMKNTQDHSHASTHTYTHTHRHTLDEPAFFRHNGRWPLARSFGTRLSAQKCATSMIPCASSFSVDIQTESKWLMNMEP